MCPSSFRLRARLLAPLLVLPLVASLVVLTARAASAAPVEDYASYDPQTRCAKHTRPGTLRLQAWAVRRFGGSTGPTLRGCDVGGRSEHKEGRAFDWTLDAGLKADRLRARRFLGTVFTTNRQGDLHARARRMGIMYIIWNDRIWRSYARFEPGPYLPCTPRRKCSKTARHRDHMHVSLSRRGAHARTSWYQRFE